MEHNIGDILQGEVVSIKSYGAFVELPNGEIGMVHISEVAEEYVSDIASYLVTGEKVMVKVIGENAEGKPNLSLKRLTAEELEEAHFSREVEEVRLALERRNGELLAHLKRRGRLKPTQREETLRDWIGAARRVLSQMGQSHLARSLPPQKRKK